MPLKASKLIELLLNLIPIKCCQIEGKIQLKNNILVALNFL